MASISFAQKPSLLIFLCFFFFFFFFFFFCGASGELQRLQHPAKPDGSLSFLVIGDWGRKGAFNQSKVAFQMGRIGKKLDIDFIVSTGDNFYDNGLTSVYDLAFEESYTKIYTAKSLQKQWYSVLGNHDYRGNVEAQLSQVLRNMEGRWLCLRSFLLNAEIVDFFFIDTTPFVDKYFTDSKDHIYDWSGVLPRKNYVKKLLQDLDSALRKSSVNWKIVVGHHSIRSAGHHGDTPELVNQLLPILEANNVDFYMNGHDHCLEHISSSSSSLEFLTSGAGSKAWRGDVKGLKGDNLRFFYDGQGFMSVELVSDNARVVFYDAFGKVLHTWSASKQLFSNI